MAARADAALARRRAELRTDCKECGRPFERSSSSVRYCSDACRERAYPRGSAVPLPPARARRGPMGKCRACSREFATGGGPGRCRLYCSPACHVEGRRASRLEYRRRLRGAGS